MLSLRHSEVDVTTLEQTNGFQALANGGVYQEGYLIDSITDNSGNVIYKHEEKPVRVYSEATASIMNDMMRSVITAKITTPFKDDITALNHELGQADWIGKTGSTNDYRDSWLIVSTPSITISSWAGHDDNTGMDSRARLRSSSYLANLINQVYQANPAMFGTKDKFELSSDVSKKKVASFTGQLSGKVTVDRKPSKRQVRQLNRFGQKMVQKNQHSSLVSVERMKTIKTIGELLHPLLSASSKKRK